MRVSTRVAALCAAVVVAGSAPAAATARASSLADAQRQVARARAAAQASAASYAKALGIYSKLSDDVVRLERSLSSHASQMSTLRGGAIDRAVRLYEGSSIPIATFLADASPMDSARRANILGRLNVRDAEAYDRLRGQVSDLKDDKVRFLSRRADQRKALDLLQRQQHALEAQLAAAASAEKQLRDALAREAASRRTRARPSRLAGFAVGGPFVCPIRGPVAFSNDFGDPRSGGRRHQGNDLFSPRGTPNVAVVSGGVTHRTGGLGGTAIWLRGDDGNAYYYAHLDHWDGGEGRVAQGDVIGYTGNSGDARGGPTHTHFELHPGGGGAANPYPTLRAHC
jgi:murein DD-endopeptidase MepM/ murein hydrolase activator NlpD